MTTAVYGQGQSLNENETIFAQRLADGQAQAFEQLVAMYQARVARLAQRLLGWDGDVDDVVQDVFLCVWNKLEDYRHQAKIWTWLTVITLNQCRSRLRRKKLFAGLPLRLNRREPQPPADQDCLQVEQDQRVRQAVNALKRPERELVVLHYLEDRSAAELAEILGVSRNTVDVRLHRARQRLKTILTDLITE